MDIIIYFYYSMLIEQSDSYKLFLLMTSTIIEYHSLIICQILDNSATGNWRAFIIR